MFKNPGEFWWACSDMLGVQCWEPLTTKWPTHLPYVSFPYRLSIFLSRKERKWYTRTRKHLWRSQRCWIAASACVCVKGIYLRRCRVLLWTNSQLVAWLRIARPLIWCSLLFPPWHEDLNKRVTLIVCFVLLQQSLTSCHMMTDFTALRHLFASPLLPLSICSRIF